MVALEGIPSDWMVGRIQVTNELRDELGLRMRV